MAKKNKSSNLFPIILIGAGIYFLMNSIRNIPENIGVGITRIRSFSLKNFPSLTIQYDMQILNLNPVALPVSGLLAYVYYQGQEIGQVTFQKPILIPANGNQFITLDIQASLLSLGLDVYDKITNKESLQGKLEIKGKIFSNGIGFPIERILF